MKINNTENKVSKLEFQENKLSLAFNKLHLIIFIVLISFSLTQCKKDDTSSTVIEPEPTPSRTLIFNDSNYTPTPNFSIKVLNVYALGYNANSKNGNGNYYSPIFVTADSNYIVTPGDYTSVLEVGINNMKLGECTVRISDSLNTYILKPNQKINVTKLNGKTIITIDNKLASKTSAGTKEVVYIQSKMSF